MPRGHRQSRRDSNHTDIVNFVRGIGMTWQDTHSISGALDGIAGYLGVDVRVEIKSPGPPSTQRLTTAEDKTFMEWKGRKPVIWITEDDVIATRDKIYKEVMG